MKKNEYISLFNNQNRKDNESSETKIHPLEQNKKSRIQTYESFYKKLVKKT